MAEMAIKGTTDPASMKGKVGELRIMGRRGDTRIIWDPDNSDEVAQAKKTFDDLRKKRFVGFKVDPAGKKGEQIKDFDPKAEKLILAPPMAGGGDLLIDPPPLVKEYLMARSLAWFNERRGDLGMPSMSQLPSALPGNTYGCLICRAFGGGDVEVEPEPERLAATDNNAVVVAARDPDLSADEDFVAFKAETGFWRGGATTTRKGAQTWYVPDYVTATACLFDAGMLPDLVDVSPEWEWDAEDYEDAGVGLGELTNKITATIAQELSRGEEPVLDETERELLVG